MLITGAISATALGVPAVTGAQAATLSGADVAPQTVNISLDINGATHQLDLDTRTTLLDALREHLHLNGTKSLFQ